MTIHITILKLPPQSPALNPMDHLRDVVEWQIDILDAHLTNLEQMCDASVML